MEPVDRSGSARAFQVMVAMRGGIRLNTFVFLPESGGSRWPIILHRTPYGIATSDAQNKTDCTKAWLPSTEEPFRGSILRGWRNITRHGYVAVYQDTRGRHGSEGEDRVYADDFADGFDTLEWIAAQPWTDQMVGMSGSSAGATTTFAAASTKHPSLRAFFAQVGASSICDDVVYEGQSIEMERLWLWVARNIPGLSRSHREAVMRRSGISAAELDAVAASAAARYERLDGARHAEPPFVGSADWLRLPLKAVVGLSIACLSPRHQHGALAIAICGTGVRHLFPPRRAGCRVGRRGGSLPAIGLPRRDRTIEEPSSTTEHISSAGAGITKSLPAGGNLLSLAIEHLVSVNPRRGSTDYGRRPILMTASTGSLK